MSENFNLKLRGSSFHFSNNLLSFRHWLDTVPECRDLNVLTLLQNSRFQLRYMYYGGGGWSVKDLRCKKKALDMPSVYHSRASSRINTLAGTTKIPDMEIIALYFNHVTLCDCFTYPARISLHPYIHKILYTWLGINPTYFSYIKIQLHSYCIACRLRVNKENQHWICGLN